MTDFEYGRWYKDRANKIWRMESHIETVGDHRIFVVSSFESWNGKNVPKRTAIINNDDPSIASIHIQDGIVTINADEPVPDDIMADVMIQAVVNDLKKSIDRYMKKEEERWRKRVRRTRRAR